MILYHLLESCLSLESNCFASDNKKQTNTEMLLLYDRFLWGIVVCLHYRLPLYSHEKYIAFRNYGIGWNYFMLLCTLYTTIDIALLEFNLQYLVIQQLEYPFLPSTIFKVLQFGAVSVWCLLFRFGLGCRSRESSLGKFASWGTSLQVGMLYQGVFFVPHTDFQFSLPLPFTTSLSSLLRLPSSVLFH